MVSAFDSSSRGSAPKSSPDWENCVVFLGKIFYCHGASLHPGLLKGTGKLNAGE